MSKIPSRKKTHQTETRTLGKLRVVEKASNASAMLTIPVVTTLLGDNQPVNMLKISSQGTRIFNRIFNLTTISALAVAALRLRNDRKSVKV